MRPETVTQHDLEQAISTEALAYRKRVNVEVGALAHQRTTLRALFGDQALERALG